MKYKGYLIDLDGTIYLGEKPIEAGKRFIDYLKKESIPFLFVTNNTTRSPEQVVKKLKDVCQIDVPVQSVYTASNATVDYMKEKKLGNRVYIIGEMGLIEAVKEAGFIIDDETPDYVVVGLDTEINYDKLTKATLAIHNGAHFIGTNPDKNIPTHLGLLPGAGSLISLIETATQTKPVIIGKPKSIIMDGALNILHLKKKDVIMVGDNYETDISAGLDNNIDTLLVLTGFTKSGDVPNLKERPTFIINSLDEWNF
ncbi:TIGR01457 family HAD-type hydrolase [Vagococcus vulneris]|uniref:HAD family hydrolase n=1 Tax=Vagococcus vulneris TaxID=1977869 RepID=A0A429ZWQ6_9ENTE|nr:TIGR01457 family HAD-type hydrolase [Vagococcus vulneris]RST98233.1 HAD family hydrolase [Vagococcus vulneris]